MENLNNNRMELHRSISHIAQQEVPVLKTSPAYSILMQRKMASIKYLTQKISEQEEEELLAFIEICNDMAKRVLYL
jgi:hypothetical protein